MNHPDLDLFLESLVVERGLRQNSLEAYQRDLIRYVTYLAGRGRQATSLNRTEVPRYLLALREAGLNPRSVARHLSAIRQFHRFLVRQGRAAEDPTAHLEAPRPWQRLPGVLSSEEVDRLLAVRETGAPQDLRNRAILELMYASGLRVSELVGLSVNDVHLENTVQIGSSGRFVYEPIKVGLRAGRVMVEVHDDIYGVAPWPWMLAQQLVKEMGLERQVDRARLEAAVEAATGVPTDVGHVKWPELPGGTPVRFDGAGNPLIPYPDADRS